MTIEIVSTGNMMHGSLTIDECYAYAMEIDNQSDADTYLELLIENNMRYFQTSYTEAMDYERANLAYYAGYFNTEIQNRIQRLFNTPQGR